MQIIIYPERADWAKILARPVFDTTSLNNTVSTVLNDIKERGDTAVYEYEEKFDKVKLSSLAASKAEIDESESLVSDELKAAIRQAKENIETFHRSQIFETKKIETTKGVTCWQKAVGIEKVGLYIPGGTAPLFSTVLMLAVPAKIAGCKEIILCSPPNKEGKIHPAILFAAKEAGVDKIFKAGGIQAIGAMAYGTGSIPKVYKIFGPGNQYVMAAKQLVSLRDVAIDMPAGPSEVQVIADETANPSFVAADLLSQAEHGADSQVILTTTSEPFISEVLHEIERQLFELPRREVAEKALLNSKLILLKDNQEIIDMTNEYAPEHLIIESAEYMDIADEIVNAGSVFLGNYTPESAGDYASGTNHTLPTNGYAKAYSGVNLDSFVKKITFQRISKEGIQNLGRTIEIMAENEELFAHKNAVTLRLKDKKQ
ncbi:MAG: histidinol dehydrogenase [Dysgonomonas sp.]